MSTFNQVKEIVIKENIFKNKGKLHGNNTIDDVFTTSELMDIFEMMEHGYEVNKIVEEIKKW